MKADEVARLAEEQQAMHEEGRKKRHADLREDEVDANRGFYRDAMRNVENFDVSKRDKRITSYKGQRDRSSHLDVITPSDAEVGYERVDWVAEGFEKEER